MLSSKSPFCSGTTFVEEAARTSSCSVPRGLVVKSAWSSFCLQIERLEGAVTGVNGIPSSSVFLLFLGGIVNFLKVIVSPLYSAWVLLTELASTQYYRCKWFLQRLDLTCHAQRSS